jgi:hypothetical protein
MSENQAYNHLMELIQNWLFGVPKPKDLMPILMLRFNPEEAAFLAKFMKPRGGSP